MEISDFYTEFDVSYEMRILGILKDPNPKLPILIMLSRTSINIYGRYLEYKHKNTMTCREIVSETVGSICKELESFGVITIPEVLIFIHPFGSDMYYERIELIFKILKYYKLDDVKVYPDKSELFITVSSDRLKVITECSFILGILKQILTFKSNVIKYLIEKPSRINLVLILTSRSGYPLCMNHHLAKKYFKRKIPIHFNKSCNGWLSSLRDYERLTVHNKTKILHKISEEIGE